MIYSKSTVCSVRARGAGRLAVAGWSVLALTIVSSPLTFSSVRAEGECGAPAPGTGVVNCTAAGNPYSAGINYNVYGPGPAEPFTPPIRSGVNVNDGVNLTVTGATIVRDPLAPPGITGAGISVQSWGGGGALIVGPVTVTVTGGSIITTGSTTTVGLNSQGIAVGTAGPITIKVDSASIETFGDGADGVYASSSTPGLVSVDTTTSTITVHGFGSSGISAENVGGGQLTVQSGKIDTAGDNSFGIFANGSGTTTVSTTAAPITTQGDDSAGVVVYKGGPGVLTITTGPITTSGASAYGVVANVFGADRTDINTTAAPISTKGDGASGILANVFNPTIGALNITSGQIDTQGVNAHGIEAYNEGSGATIINTTAAPITTQGSAANGILATAFGTGPLTIQSGVIATTGEYANGIQADNYNSGFTYIDSTAGAISTQGTGSNGIVANQYGGSPLTILSGSITTQGFSGNGIYALNYGSSLTSIDTRGGAIETRGDAAYGIFAAPFGGGPLQILTGNVTTGGATAPAVGAVSGASVNIDTTAGLLTTTGTGSAGIFAGSGLPNYALTINSGAIQTSGDGSYGIAAVALGLADQQGTPTPTAGSVNITNSAPITATGAGSGGIVALTYADGSGPSGPVSVNANANITATGQNAVGIAAASSTGQVEVNVASGVSVQGGWSANPSDLSTQVATLPSPGGGTFATFGSNLPAAGVVVFSGATSAAPAMTINNNGLIGALNDRAITMGYPCATVTDQGGSGGNNRAPPPGGGGNGGGSNGNGSGGNAFLQPGLKGVLSKLAAIVGDAIIPSAHASGNPCVDGVPPVQSLTVNNNNTITGYVTLWGGAAHTVNNAATFDVRNFADTNGDGVRDTKAVSISDFGGPNSTFNNLSSGIVKFLPVANAPSTNATGYYVPTTGTDSRALESSVYNLNNEGVVQGQFVNLQTFNNSGTIDLRGPAVGNTLIMTNNPTAGGAPGTGVFVSDGGRLLLNSVLNAGVAPGGQTGSQSDVLVVDSTQVGAGGATLISVTNVGGAGALTPGNGIELVEVRNKPLSAPGVFTLQGQYVTTTGQQAIVAGAYAYALYQNGVGTDSADGNWYLRSQLTPSTPPQPGDPQPPVLPPTPIYNPGVPLYETYPQVLALLNSVPTMQQRVGNRYWEEAAPARPAETVFCKDAAKNFRCTVSNDQAKYYADYAGQGGMKTTIEGSATWASIDGTINKYTPAFSTSGSGFTGNTWQLRAGLDAQLMEMNQGNLFGGLNVFFGRATAKVNSIQGFGSIAANGYGIGGTLTWLDRSGFYVDAQAKATWYSSDLSSLTAQRQMAGNNMGFGYALSLETGRKIPIKADWSVTPQAQLIYSAVSFRSFIDPFGARVSLKDGDSLRGRLGLSLDHDQSWKDGNGNTRRTHVYGIANLYYEFLNGTQVDVAGVGFTSRGERLWGGVGVGGTYNWDNDKYSLYGQVGLNSSLQHFGKSYALNGTVGFRMKW